MQRIRKGLYLLEASGWVNSYLIEGPHGLTLVDTGHSRGAEALGEEIEKGGFALKDLEQILITHAHFDHAGGAAILLERKRVKVFAHPQDVPAIQGRSPRQALHRRFSAWIVNLWFPFRPLEVVVPIKQGETLRALPQWQILHTPGHTAGSLSLYQPTEKALLCGDAFSNRGDKLGLSPAAYNDDHVEAARTARKLSALDVEVLCCGHGPVIRTSAALRIQKAVDAL